MKLVLRSLVLSVFFISNIGVIKADDIKLDTLGVTVTTSIDTVRKVVKVEEENIIINPLSVVDYIQGDTRNPKIDMGYIRDDNTELRKRFLTDPNYDPSITPVKKPEKMPQFVGGIKAMHTFLRENLEYPEDAKVLGMQGVVSLQFVVMPNGDIKNVEVIKGLETSCDKEAVRLVELMPRWIPGEYEGQKVPVSFKLPIEFIF